MTNRIVRWTIIVILATVAGSIGYLCAFPVPLHELDTAWYHTRRGATEALGQTFLAHHKCAVLRAQADHFVHPVGPGRVVAILAASPPNDAGDVFVYFGSQFASGDSGLHLLPVYCWSERQQRLVWKALQDNSP
jgi:hypothetical protein